VSRRPWLGPLVKVAISGLLIVLLFTRLSLAEIRTAFASPRWPWLAAALGVYGVSALLGAVQWTWILRVSGIATRGWELLRLYLVGLFFNNFLPANVGGDAVKIFDLGRREGQPLKVFCATLLDRLLGLSALTFLALVAVAVASARTTSLPPVYPLFVAMVLWTGLLSLLLSRRIASRVPGLLRFLRLVRLAELAEQVVAEFHLYRTRERWFAAIFFWALLVQILRVSTHILVALGLSIALVGEQALQLFVLVPLLGIAIALPISVNGIGLREALSAVTFTSAGIAASAAVAMQLTAYLVQVAFSLVGGILFWRGRREAGREGDQGA
jgi:uncharacterized protein (TIRG00374 family)